MKNAGVVWVSYPNALLAKTSFLLQTLQTKMWLTLERTIQNSSVAIASFSASVIGILTAKGIAASTSAPEVVNEDIKPSILKIWTTTRTQTTENAALSACIAKLPIKSEHMNCERCLTSQKHGDVLARKSQKETA